MRRQSLALAGPPKSAKNWGGGGGVRLIGWIRYMLLQDGMELCPGTFLSWIVACWCEVRLQLSSLVSLVHPSEKKKSCEHFQIKTNARKMLELDIIFLTFTQSDVMTFADIVCFLVAILLAARCDPKKQIGNVTGCGLISSGNVF